MRARRVDGSWLAGGLAAVLAAGCGAGPGATGGATILDQTPVEQVGRMLTSYRRGGLKPPPKGSRDLPVYKPGPVPPPRGTKDIAPLARGFPQAVNALRDRSVLLYWRTDLGDDPAAAATVLAYAAEAPDRGGQVLMRDGTVRTMTAAEFRAAPRPEGGKTDDALPAPAAKGR